MEQEIVTQTNLNEIEIEYLKSWHPNTDIASVNLIQQEGSLIRVTLNNGKTLAFPRKKKEKVIEDWQRNF